MRTGEWQGEPGPADNRPGIIRSQLFNFLNRLLVFGSLGGGMIVAVSSRNGLDVLALVVVAGAMLAIALAAALRASWEIAHLPALDVVPAPAPRPSWFERYRSRGEL